MGTVLYVKERLGLIKEGEQKAGSEKATAKQRSFNKKCELIFLTGLFFIHQLYLCL